MKNKLILALTLGLFTAASVSATLIFEEYFHANDFGGNDSNLANGTNWNGGTNQLRFVDTVNLSFSNPNYNPSGNAGTGAARTNASEPNGRGSWSTVSATALTGEFWFSALHQRNINEDGSYSIFNLGTANNIDPTNNSFNTSTSFGLYNEGSTLRPFIATGNANDWTAPTTGTASADTPLLFLARGNTSNGNLDIWIFESSDTIPQSANDLGAATISTSDALLGNITRLWIGKRGNTGGTTYFDALRLSTASGDAGFEAVTVIPEPGTLALVAIALGSLALFRRRR